MQLEYFFKMEEVSGLLEFYSMNDYLREIFRPIIECLVGITLIRVTYTFKVTCRRDIQVKDLYFYKVV